MPAGDPAVAAAVEACARTVALVVALADARAAAAVVARDEWRGAARERFDLDVARLDRDAAHLVADLRRVAAALGGAGGG